MITAWRIPGTTGSVEVFVRGIRNANGRRPSSEHVRAAHPGRLCLTRWRAWLALLSVMTCFLVGCGLTATQRAGVERFSAATKDFAGISATEFVKSRTDVIEMNTLRVELMDDTVVLERLDEHFTVARVTERLRAIQALQDYADLLSTLVSTSQKEELKNAADGFVTSLRKVKGVSLTDEQAGAVGTAVAAVGGLFVEHLRARATRQVVLSTHESVLQVVALVERDFDSEAEHWSLGYDKVAVALRGAAAGAGGATRRPAPETIGRARVLARQNQERFRAVGADVGKSAKTLRVAQINLREALENPRIGLEDINAYVAQVEELVTAYRVLRDR